MDVEQGVCKRISAVVLEDAIDGHHFAEVDKTSLAQLGTRGLRR
jgi:hypothetical protein